MLETRRERAARRRAFPSIQPWYAGDPCGRVLGGTSEIAVYESYRKAFGIAAGLAIGYEADGIDPHNNQYIRSLAAERPWLATIAHAAAVPAFQPASASAFLDDGHLGIAIYALDSAGGASVAAWPTETWRVLGARRAIISLNARNQSTATLAPLVERETSCTFLFSHLGLPGRVSVPPTIVQAAERLGHCSDWPTCRTFSSRFQDSTLSARASARPSARCGGTVHRCPALPVRRDTLPLGL